MPEDLTSATVTRFLEPEWMTALDDAARGLTVDGDTRLVVQQVVRSEDGETRYHLVVGDGRVRVVPGRAEAPDVTFTQDYEVAAALSRGDLTAQQALSEGGLRLSGDLAGLARRAGALAALGDVFAAVRSQTKY
jgi:putative sterol carrier protein